MFKHIGKIILTMIAMSTIAACSSVENELTDIQSDLIQHVKEPIIHIHEQMKEYERVVLDNPGITNEEYEEYKEQYTAYIQDEMTKVIRTSKDYLSSYKELQTDEGRAILDAYQHTYEAYFHLLEENGQFLVDLLADELTDEDFDDFDTRLEKMDTRINEEVDALYNLFVIYAEEYDVHFVDPLY